MGQPLGATLGVGQVLFVQYLEGGFAARQLGKHGVGAGAWESGVQQFDNNVNLPDALANGLARQVHMARKPLDGHRASGGLGLSGLAQALGRQILRQVLRKRQGVGGLDLALLVQRVLGHLLKVRQRVRRQSQGQFLGLGLL